MSTLEDYQSKLETIAAIPEEKLIIPDNIPVDTYVQEAERLHRWCQQDKAELTARGLSWELADDLPVRSAALMEAESRWNAQRFLRKEAGEQWVVESPAAYDLRNVILHEFRFAYRNNDWLSGRVRAIADGGGHADMLQDLNDLAVLGKENPEPLAAINFDMTLLDRAAQTADEKGTLWAEASCDRAGYKETKKVRDQAYTHLKEAVDEIRGYGQHVFWRNEARLIGYRSYYLARKSSKKADDTNEKKEEPQPPDSDTNAETAGNSNSGSV